MRIDTLQLHNIGPFKDQTIFFNESVDNTASHVAIITGENGAGKSIVIDSIRALLYGSYGEIERDISSAPDSFIAVNLRYNGSISQVTAKRNPATNSKSFSSTNRDLHKIFSHLNKNPIPNFVVDYWSSKISNDEFKIQGISNLEINNPLRNSLSGIQSNAELVRTICFFDYLRGSNNPQEILLGDFCYSKIERIVELSINEGKLEYVSRSTLQPMVKIGRDVMQLDKVSSGSLYLIQRYLHLVKLYYSVAMANGISGTELFALPGLLLIDEAENHLHPKWQKKFIKDIVELFPNLQIIVTTHSPFIVSSIEDAKVFVCKRTKDEAWIEDQTSYYSNKPVEEILMSELFNTSNFNIDISLLLEARKIAIKENNSTEKEKIEQELISINPDYFNFFNVDSILSQINK